MKIFVLLFFLLFNLAHSFSQNISCKVKGSDILLPLTQKVAEVYMKINPGSSIIVTGGGSGVGLTALQDGTADIAQSSRKMKLDEKIKLLEIGRPFSETVIAFDALAIIVNLSNQISQLTREELEKIYTGKITNWKQLGGEDMNIVVYSRESSSGSFEFFKEHVLDKKSFASSVLLMPATGAIVQSVSQTRGAIGYVGLAYLDASVKTIKISYDGGITYISPSVATVKNNTYPVCRPLYYYFLMSQENNVKPFIDYVLSDKGQKIVREIGYVPVN